MNLVSKRIQELSSFELGPRKKYVRAVRRKAVIPNRRYTWMLFEDATDADPVDTVVLDVDLDQALEIDRRVAETLHALPRSPEKDRINCERPSDVLAGTGQGS